MEYKQNLSAGINRNKGRGVREIAEKYNKLELYSPKDRQLNKTVLHRAVVERSEWGVSPPKRGRRESIDPQVTQQLTMQVAMMQASEVGEASFRVMDNTIPSWQCPPERNTKVPSQQSKY